MLSYITEKLGDKEKLCQYADETKPELKCCEERLQMIIEGVDSMCLHMLLRSASHHVGVYRGYTARRVHTR